MIAILRKIFKANLEKSTIAINDKFSYCGCETTINITPTSGGFGLHGGVLFKCAPDGYFAKCPNCYKVNSKMAYKYKPKYNMTLLNKTTQDGLDLTP